LLPAAAPLVATLLFAAADSIFFTVLAATDNTTDLCYIVACFLILWVSEVSWHKLVWSAMLWMVPCIPIAVFVQLFLFFKHRVDGNFWTTRLFVVDKNKLLCCRRHRLHCGRHRGLTLVISACGNRYASFTKSFATARE
jgi:isoprenylcysteine carboxyl methyltransferase (ICMT) family protein YpbQ